MIMLSHRHLRLSILALFLCFGAWPVFAQEVPKPTYQSGNFDPETASLPPMDADSLSFTPSKPEGALDITRLSDCKEAAGKWQSYSLVDDDENTMYEVGCLKEDTKVGRWTMAVSKSKVDVPKTEALGFTWYIDGKASGYRAKFSRPNGQLLSLIAMKDDQKHGAALEWYYSGTLRSIYHYTDGLKDGSFEIYESDCLPTVRGSFNKGKASGIWENYFTNGVLMSRIDFSKTIQTGAGTSASWAQQFDAKKGAKIGEGYIIGNPFEGEVIKVGEWQMFTITGNPWLKLKFDAESGALSKETLKTLCPQNGEPSFEHEQVVISCTKENFVLSNRTYYQTGEIQADITMPDTPNVKIVEYHPSGEILAQYEMDGIVPKGTVGFFDRKGKEYGSSTLVSNSGKWTRYWYTGEIRETGSFQAGFKEGTWTSYNESGTKLAEENYRAGVLQGQSRTWFANGMVDSIMPYDGGVLQGKAMGFWTFGNPAWEVPMQAGAPKGKAYEYTGNGSISVEKNYRSGANGSVASVKYYYPNGKLRASGDEDSFGNRLGLWELYLLNGQLWRSIDYDMLYDTESGDCTDVYNGEYLIDEEKRETGCKICRVNRVSPSNPLEVKIAHWTWYNEKGAVEKSGAYQLDRMDGEWQFFYPNGRLMLKGSYSIDKAVGEWAGYFHDGHVKFEGRYKDGRESGLWRTYFASGDKNKASEGQFEDGKREGAWTWYHENGKIRDNGAFKAGKEVGTWISHYESGKKMGEGVYSEGKREGLWTWWREDGQVWRESYYVAGKEEAVPKKLGD